MLNVLSPTSKTTSYTWDSQNRIQTMEDGGGNVRFFNTYQANGMLQQQTLFASTSATGSATYRLYATTPLERTLIDPNGNTRVLTYNSAGLLTQETDGLHHTTTTTYSAGLFNGSPADRSITRTDALGNTTRVDLNANNLPTTITNPLVERLTLTYDTQHPGKPKTITNWMGQTTTLTYDTAGNLTAIADPEQQMTTMTYNSRGQVLTITNALTKTTAYTYNSSGDLSSITRPVAPHDHVRL